ncbi:unnamed protein product [Cylicostephanus goldi]|uniref:Uncharacterized protein n=1 Tax=Cylicostephanus goldi TaxID=71465 RepID=A0A3P7MW61_CYLGO|nr:unnamed protein product [Cylicostephanus goldi]
MEFWTPNFIGTGLSIADLLEFGLHYYEPTCDPVSSGRYAFLEAVFRAVSVILRENEAIRIDFNAVFAHYEAIKWYHKFVILKSFFDTSTWSNVTFKYPWTGKAKDDAELFCEIPCILTAWPGDNSDLFESFICENFQSEDAEVISRSLLLAFDRGLGGDSVCVLFALPIGAEELSLQQNLHLFARVVEKLSADVRDWERFLSEEEYKFQSVSFAQVFDCTGISFGFFDDEDVSSTQEIVRNADEEKKADSCSHSNAPVRFDDSVFIADGKTTESGTQASSSTSKSSVTGSQEEHLSHPENVELNRETCIGSSDSDVATLLEEIIEKVANMWPAPSMKQPSPNICRLAGSSDDPAASATGEGDVADVILSQLRPSMLENANDNLTWTMNGSSLSFDWEQTEEPRKDEILLVSFSRHLLLEARTEPSISLRKIPHH